MPPPRCTAQPIAEGCLKTSAGMKLVWREFRWNTGKTNKMWFVDPEDVNDGEIEVRPLDNSKSTGNRT